MRLFCSSTDVVERRVLLSSKGTASISQMKLFHTERLKVKKFYTLLQNLEKQQRQHDGFKLLRKRGKSILHELKEILDANPISHAQCKRECEEFNKQMMELKKKDTEAFIQKRRNII